MALSVAPILSRASTLLHDETEIRWSTTELLSYLNDGLLQISSLLPLLFTERATVTLDAGVYQAVPDGKRHLHRVISNGTGQIVREATQVSLDSQEPNWYARNPVSVVKYVINANLNHGNYLCYPPNDGTGQLDAIFTIDPPVASADSTIAIDSTYANHLLMFTLHRAFLKDSDALDQTKSDMYFESFQRYMAGSVMGDAQAREK